MVRLVLPVVLVLISSVVLLPIHVAAPYQDTLDQEQTVISAEIKLFSSPPESSSQFLGQTFTAGLTGSLMEVDLAIACDTTPGGSCASFGPVTVEIHSANPSGSSLASTSLEPAAIPLWNGTGLPSVFVPFTFSFPTPVVEGIVYAIVITTTNAPAINGYSVGEAVNLYAAGTGWSGFSDAWHSRSGADLAFKTYVAPTLTTTTTTSEPGLPVLALLMIIGYGLIKRSLKRVSH